MKHSIVTFLVAGFLAISYGLFCENSFASNGHDKTESHKYMTEKEYQQALSRHDQFHALMRSGDHLSKQGKYQEAEAVYLKAMEMARKSSLEAIARGVLLKFYEQNNADEKALEQVDWFLTGGDPNAPMRQELLETKQRLLQKIAEKNKDPMGQFKENVRQLKPEAQKEFVQSLSDTKIMGQFKQAMEAEQRNDFAGALVIYESLLRQKEFVVKEMGIHAWVMLYPGIQRTAELSGNSEKEKEALIWINANLLNPAGGYHQSLSYLEARSITHLKERIKVLGENS